MREIQMVEPERKRSNRSSSVHLNLDTPADICAMPGKLSRGDHCSAGGIRHTQPEFAELPLPVRNTAERKDRDKEASHVRYNSSPAVLNRDHGAHQRTRLTSHVHHGF